MQYMISICNSSHPDLFTSIRVQVIFRNKESRFISWQDFVYEYPIYFQSSHWNVQGNHNTIMYHDLSYPSCIICSSCSYINYHISRASQLLCIIYKWCQSCLCYVSNINIMFNAYLMPYTGLSIIYWVIKQIMSWCCLLYLLLQV